MPDRQAVEQLRQANQGVSNLMADSFAGLWGSLDLSRPEAARDALLEGLPYLTDQYGDIAALGAASWYDEQRALAGLPGASRAVMAPAVSHDAVQGAVRYAAGHLFTDQPTGTFDYLRIAADKYALQPGRNTIAFSSAADGVAWARVPRGEKTCAFCLAMASRGFVYHSEASAGGDGEGYHGDCHCVPTPEFDRHGIEGYDPDALRVQYLDAEHQGSGGLSSTLSALRQQQGIS